MKIMGVPKTIDNDVMGTDHTPGYGSAAKFIAASVSEMLRDCAVYTIKAVTIIEIMGRDAGWLTSSAAIGRKVTGFAPDYVYLPERNFDMDSFYADVEAALAKHPNVVIAVSEGVHFADGRYVCETASTGVDAFGHKMLSGTAKALELAVKDKFGCKVRSIELNLPQRCAAHLQSKTDIDESVRVGKAAVNFAREGVTREMITIDRVSENPYRTEMGHSDVSKIANMIKYVNDEFINEKGNDVTDACCRYLLPLIKGENYPEYVDGVPDFVVIK